MFIRVLPFLDKFINQPFQAAVIRAARGVDMLDYSSVLNNAYMVVVNALECG
jgi:hypothetical protein